MNTVRKQLLLPDEAPTGAGIRVAVLDTGVDLDHPDLRDRVNVELSGSFTTKEDLCDRNGHGSHVAGIIGGSGAASNGYFRGIAPSCDLVALKISETNSGLEWTAQRAVERAIEVRADVINYSHGYCPDIGDPPWVWSNHLTMLEELLELADDRGIMCIVAAGNGGPNEGSISRPGGLDRVLTVGAVNRYGHVHDNSGRGPFRRSRELRANAVRRFDRESAVNIGVTMKPDVVAPGEITAPRAASGTFFGRDIEVVDPLYMSIAGTSQATAVISGLAALVLQELRAHDADLGPKPARTLRRLFCHAARKLDDQPQHEFGNGLVIWPTLIATVEDFLTDTDFRGAVLAGTALRLLL